MCASWALFISEQVQPKRIPPETPSQDTESTSRSRAMTSAASRGGGDMTSREGQLRDRSASCLSQSVPSVLAIADEGEIPPEHEADRLTLLEWWERFKEQHHGYQNVIPANGENRSYHSYHSYHSYQNNSTTNGENNTGRSMIYLLSKGELNIDLHE